MKRAKRMDVFQSSIFTELKNMKLDYTQRTGNETIDTQHKELIDRIQNFVTACQNYGSRKL